MVVMEHSDEFLRLVDDTKGRIREIGVSDARERVKGGAALIDVREDLEYAGGHAAGAEHLGRGVLERDIVGKHPEKDEELILYCGGGYRSALAAESLQKMGYTNVWSMTGGWKAWKDSGAPVE